jgi:aspartate/tyrosine/aromatic aminotransferase
LRELAAAIVSEPELRLAVINAVLANVATKQDVYQLREEMRNEISQLRQEMNQLRRDMNANFRWTVGLIIAIWGTTVIPLLMRMAGVA